MSTMLFSSCSVSAPPSAAMIQKQGGRFYSCTQGKASMLRANVTMFTSMILLYCDLFSPCRLHASCVTGHVTCLPFTRDVGTCHVVSVAISFCHLWQFPAPLGCPSCLPSNRDKLEFLSWATSLSRKRNPGIG